MRWSLSGSSLARNVPCPGTGRPLAYNALARILSCMLIATLMGCGPSAMDDGPPAEGAADTAMEQDVATDASTDESGSTGTLAPDDATAGDDSDAGVTEANDDLAVAAEVEELVAGLFSSAIGESEPAWQDVTVRRMNTTQLAELRGLPTPQPGTYGRRGGVVWVVGFRTTHTVSPDQMFLENMADFQDVEASELADDQGLTTVYYILSAVGSPDNVHITPLSSGIIPSTDPRWSLDDLAEITSR